jgi:multicomponent Na+:H+ antiporter subunit D
VGGVNLETLSLNLLGLLTPFLVILAFITPLLSKLLKSSRRAPLIIALIGGVYAAVASTVVFCYEITSRSPLIYTYGGWPPHFGIVYEIDLFNGLLGFLVAWIMLAIILYSSWYSKRLDDASWYFTLLLGLTAGVLGCLYTGDAFNFFVMLEVLSISTYGLVAYLRNRAEAVEATAKYALIGAVATTMYFLALVIIYSGYGTVNMAYLAERSSAEFVVKEPSLRYLSLLAVSLALWTFTFKSAIFPSHFWLVDANPEAPHPVSVALSGLVESVGIYAAGRFLYTIFRPNGVLAVYHSVILIVLVTLGAISGVVCALMMLNQRDIKRLLAYSSISHTGIVYMGLFAGFLVNNSAVEAAITGAIVHAVSHVIAKTALFMSSGLFIETSGSRDLDDMRGVGRAHPLALVATVISTLSLIGLVPFIGFYSKLLIILGYISAGFVIVPILVIAITALSVPGYMKILSSVAFGIPAKEYKRPSGETWVEVLILLIALSLLVLGVIFWYIMPIFQDTTSSLISGAGDYINSALERIPEELRSLMRGVS